MEKNNDRDTKFELLTNKLNKMLFRFLIREYYSVSINPFYCLKLLTKIIHNDVNDNLKEQCALFLVYILQNLCVKLGNTIYREACSYGKMSHLNLTIIYNCHLSDFLLVSRIFSLNLFNKSSVNLFNNLVNSRKKS